MTYLEINGIRLRDWQVSAREKLVENFKLGHKKQVLMCPTGGGKTILAMYLISECLSKGKKAVFIADRRVLINQTASVADYVGIKDYSIMMADDPRYDPGSKFQIASAQTISRREWPDADLYIIDEVHTLMRGWTENINSTDAAFIGLSATPFGSLGNFFSAIVNATTMESLTRDGVLVPFKVKSCKKIDMSGAEKLAGEWTAKSVYERGKGIIGDVIQSWIDHGEGRKTIVFGANIMHCEAMCRSFNEAGINARTYTSRTHDDERKVLLEDFNNPDGDIKILISVEALAKGFDNRYVSCICDVRPLSKSLGTAMQMWGRMLRSKPDGYIQDALLLDFSGNILRFASDFERIFFHGMNSLKTGELYNQIPREGNEKKVHKCPICAFEPYAGRCISCGHVKTQKENEVEYLGELYAFDPFNKSSRNSGENGLASKEFVKKKTKEIVDNIKKDDMSKQYLDKYWRKCVTCCNANGNPSTAKGRASHLFKSIFGIFPPDFVTEYSKIHGESVDKSIANLYKHNLIKFHKRSQ
jgi:superfamily II DNA or RNA helicase